MTASIHFISTYSRMYYMYIVIMYEWTYPILLGRGFSSCKLDTLLHCFCSSFNSAVIENINFSSWPVMQYTIGIINLKKRNFCHIHQCSLLTMFCPVKISLHTKLMMKANSTKLFVLQYEQKPLAKLLSSKIIAWHTCMTDVHIGHCKHFVL